ncbi:MAG TPA: hypothetical protein VMC02_14150, partial [Steroidobacteraceae bacterium]|nr:hypothetical protein [Steroidobacteraceae bacterium]
MAILFREYELLANSELFDPEYYIRENPDVAGLNLDPIIHYLETGGGELRNPSGSFDARRYVEQCRQRGERVGNPLLHYLESRAAADPRVGNGATPPAMQLFVDSAVVDDAGILHVLGWVVCLAPIASVEVFVEGNRLAAADYGKARDDVAASHGEYPNARQSGFALHVDVNHLGSGEREITVRAAATTGISREAEIRISMPRAPQSPPASIGPGKVELFSDIVQVRTSGQVFIKGWAVAAAATERLTVLLDGIDLGAAKIGIERPDVGNHFPQLAHARHSGFVFQGKVPEISAGEHLLVLRLLADGVETEVLLPVLATPGGEAEVAADAVPESGANGPRLSIDLPILVDGAVATPIRSNLEIAGWALGRSDSATIEISIDGKRVTTATTGVRRRDVHQAFPDRPGALTAGFSVILPHRTLPLGSHVVSVALADSSGEAVRSQFRIQVEDAPDTEGPWALRRKMTLAEVNIRSRPILGVSKAPAFAIVVPVSTGHRMLAQARATLTALRSQVYEHWRVYILPPARAVAALRRSVLEGLEDISERVEVLVDDRAIARLVTRAASASHLLVIHPGDDLGCDALLEFAVHAALNPDADFLYCDDRRVNAATGKVEAFFKPQWSPDLLLSMNYLGRAWCASAEVFRRAAIRPAELRNPDAYELALRVTEQARAIVHVPATLLQAASGKEDAAAAHDALQRALKRRGIDGRIKAGRAAGTYRLCRKVTQSGRVSIIIPT